MEKALGVEATAIPVQEVAGEQSSAKVQIPPRQTRRWLFLQQRQVLPLRQEQEDIDQIQGNIPFQNKQNSRKLPNRSLDIKQAV